MKCDVCGRGVGDRRRVGPTGKEVFSVLIDSCYGCGTIYPVEKDLIYKHKRWVDRWNERMKNNYLTKGKENV